MPHYEIPPGLTRPKDKRTSAAVKDIAEAVENGADCTPDEAKAVTEDFVNELYTKVLGLGIEAIPEAFEGPSWQKSVHDALDRSATFKHLRALIDGRSKVAQGPFATLLENLLIIIKQAASSGGGEGDEESDSEEGAEGDSESESSGEGKKGKGKPDKKPKKPKKPKKQEKEEEEKEDDSSGDDGQDGKDGESDETDAGAGKEKENQNNEGTTPEERQAEGGGEKDEMSEEELQAMVDAALEEAREEAADEAMSIQFGKQDRKLTPLPPPVEEQIKRAMDKLKQTKYRDAINKIGRLMESYKGPSVEDDSRAVDTITDLTRGNDISRMAMSEAIRLVHPGLKKLWRQSYVERSLLQYQIEGKTPRKDRGPMVICLDESGSMEGENTIMGRAFIAIALYHAASKGRHATVIGFDTRIMWEAKLEPRGVNLEEAINAVFSYAPAGGTDFTPPLKRALDIVRAEPNTDILIVTDGQGPLDAALAEELKKQKAKGMRLFGFALDGAQSTPTLKPLVDEWLVLDDKAVQSTAFQP
jgi:uncharacterized protein with von Willebrand factor type A (vWA) domain